MKINYFKILKFLNSKEKSLFDISVEEQKTFLNSLSEPKDDFERSYNQYLCQMFFVKDISAFAYNFFSFLLIIPTLTLYLLNPKKKNIIKFDAVANWKYLDNNILPKNIVKQYNSIKYINWDEGRKLSFNNLLFIYKIFLKHPFSYYFLLKCIFKIAEYNYAIKLYQPKAILVHAEYSFTSSILTAYCNRYSIKHIDVMHGEKLFNIRDSFFRYDECYIWDKHYEELFISMRVGKGQFKIHIPSSLSIDKISYLNNDYYSDFKYYLANYSEEEIKGIIDSMSFLKDKGYSLKFRPHPRYSNIKLLLKYVKKANIEYPDKISIEQSIINCDYVVGSYSTVLLQGYFSGKIVVIDDVTYDLIYKKLFERNYILLNKKHFVLSNLNSNL